MKSKIKQLLALTEELEKSMLVKSFFSDIFDNGSVSLKSIGKFSDITRTTLPYKAWFDYDHRLSSDQYLMLHTNFNTLEIQAIKKHWGNV
jgi:hypothetical protein